MQGQIEQGLHASQPALLRLPSPLKPRMLPLMVNSTLWRRDAEDFCCQGRRWHHPDQPTHSLPSVLVVAPRNPVNFSWGPAAEVTTLRVQAAFSRTTECMVSSVYKQVGPVGNSAGLLHFEHLSRLSPSLFFWYAPWHHLCQRCVSAPSTLFAVRPCCCFEIARLRNHRRRNMSRWLTPHAWGIVCVHGTSPFQGLNSSVVRSLAKCISTP